MDTVQSESSLVSQGVKRVTLKAVITRADGTVEDLGTVAEYHQDEPQAQGIGTITLCHE
jgi:hypothetical protein